MERTEGWPAGLYLATLSLAGRSDPDEFVRKFSGGNRFIGDYLTEEVLSRHTDRVREFITTVSILDRFSASLCDHVLGITDSAAILHDLERSNLFVVPLDEERDWFRFHHLFAAVARSELELTHPDHVRSLHARAAEWFRSHGHVEEASSTRSPPGTPRTPRSLVQASWLTTSTPAAARPSLGWLESLGPRCHRQRALRHASRLRGWPLSWATSRTWPTISRPWERPRLRPAPGRLALRRVRRRDDRGPLRLRRPDRRCWRRRGAPSSSRPTASSPLLRHRPR